VRSSVGWPSWRRANEILKTASAVFRTGGARPSTQVIVGYIDSHRERFGVEPICAVLSRHGMKIAPSTYYAHKATPVTDAALTEAYLVNALVTLWEENWGVYGFRRLYHAARRAGLEVGRDQVGRLTAIVGIRGARQAGAPDPAPGAADAGRVAARGSA
jgi:HTH-like domain